MAQPAKSPPRDAAHRYGIYVLREGKPHRLTTVEDPSDIGSVLVALAYERWQEDDYSYEPHGVLDRVTGRWICGLWHRKAVVDEFEDLPLEEGSDEHVGNS